jgi:hypothetical protein
MFSGLYNREVDNELASLISLHIKAFQCQQNILVFH